MFCPALPTEGEADNESSSETVFILATSYLAVSLLFHAVFFYHLTYHSRSSRLLTRKEVLRNYIPGSSGHKIQTVMKLI